MVLHRNWKHLASDTFLVALHLGHVPRCQHRVRSVSGALRRQLLHPSCKHTTWCAAAGCRCCGTAKCFQRRSWVCWILEPNCHWCCPWTAGCCGNCPTSLGSRLGERRGRLPGQLHCLPCWWQQQHRGREEAEEGCPGHLRQVRCGCDHHPGHQRQRLHACLRRQARPRWHRGQCMAHGILPNCLNSQVQDREWLCVFTSSTAQGGGGSFKDDRTL